MKSLKKRLKKMHLLSREDRIKLVQELNYSKPEFLKPLVPKWWWWWKCKTKVLIVADGGLNFGIGGFDLSEFLTTFNKLEAQSFINYEVTLAHRSGFISNNPNPVVVDHLINFKFDTSVNLSDYDQVWLFAISPSGGIRASEKNAIETYMNGGGGLFATGDHGYLGNAMCGDITRVKDMRYWTDAPPSSPNDVNEVSMSGKRRNDTNRPTHGDATSRFFDNQSDDIPQTIAVRTFGNGMPHPLLSIKQSIRPSGIIDIMPDHPHEGECAPETSFTVNSVTVPTQIISTSFVLGGSTTVFGGKTGTDPHCFPSIAVWDGRLANAGRIVVDSTWHHFVNINLTGAGSNLENGVMTGLKTSDFDVIQQYYMNIATWMTRRKFFFCWWPCIIFELLNDSQVLEASLNNPEEDIDKIPIAHLNSIGALAEEILGAKFNPGFARSALLEIFENVNKDLCKELDVWRPSLEDSKKSDTYYQNWINTDNFLHTAIGAGFIALRDNKMNVEAEMNEKMLENIEGVFLKGMQAGQKLALANFRREFKYFDKNLGK